MPGISVGREKGFPTSKINAKARPARSVGRLSKRTGMVRELVGEVAPNLALALDALVLGEGVDLVHEDLEDNVRVDGVRGGNGGDEARERLGVVVLCVEDPDEGAAPREGDLRLDGGRRGVDVSGEVPDLEVHVRRVCNVVLDELVCGVEEERLVRRAVLLRARLGF